MIIITKKKLLKCYRMKSLIGNLREQYILFYTPKKKIIAQKHLSYQPVFYEIPLLYEENLFNNFNVTVFVNSDTTKRKQRVLRRGVTENYFKLMNNKQIKENIKKNKSTFTVNNNGSILNLRLNIIKLLNKL